MIDRNKLSFHYTVCRQVLCPSLYFRCLLENVTTSIPDKLRFYIEIIITVFPEVVEKVLITDLEKLW